MKPLISEIPDLVWLDDLDGVYLACNTKFERHFGAREQDIVGKRDHDVIDPVQSETFR